MRRSKHLVSYVLEGDFRRTILQIYHDTAANGTYFGRNKTIHKIKQRYFWPSIPIKPPDGVWQLVSMDFYGPISSTSHRENKYIISFTDVLSKFIVTKAVRDNKAQTAVRFVKEDIISKFGTPCCILTDNATHFPSTIMDELIKQIGATHLYS
ncbi:unnamed protein product, partial [Rotaria sp. Silwood1]